MAAQAYHTSWQSPVGTLGLWVTDRGLLRLGLPNDYPEQAARWLRKHEISEVVSASPDDPHFSEILSQLEDYFSGKLREFHLPLDLRGTEFQKSVWEAVYRVPWGQTRSYGEIAAEIGQPSAVRAVGAANGANPVAIIVPCHRIIASNGALQGYGGGLSLKAELLKLEGIAPGRTKRPRPEDLYERTLFS